VKSETGNGKRETGNGKRETGDGRPDPASLFRLAARPHRAGRQRPAGGRHLHRRGRPEHVLRPPTSPPRRQRRPGRTDGLLWRWADPGAGGDGAVAGKQREFCARVTGGGGGADRGGGVVGAVGEGAVLGFGAGTNLQVRRL